MMNESTEDNRKTSSVSLEELLHDQPENLVFKRTFLGTILGLFIFFTKLSNFFDPKHLNKVPKVEKL